jgi:pimeloyl-ACP methyl ester carboxylesterase
MESEIFYFKGDLSGPLFIFIHGMGMDAKMWAEPASARILGGKYPLSILLEETEMRTSFHDFRAKGFSVLAWSQRRPAGPIQIAVDELKGLVTAYASNTPGSIFLIGHSRGGLIARQFVQEWPDQIKGVLTIATPHHGSSLAKWAIRLSPVSSMLNKIMDLSDKEVRNSVHRVVAFLSSKAMKEVLPQSDFLMSLSTKQRKGLFIVSIGGTYPGLVRIGKTILPDLLGTFLPEIMIPDELKDGEADGFVTAKSAIYPGNYEHVDFHAHHAALLFDHKVREYVLNKVLSHTGSF